MDIIVQYSESRSTPQVRRESRPPGEPIGTRGSLCGNSCQRTAEQCRGSPAARTQAHETIQDWRHAEVIKQVDSYSQLLIIRIVLLRDCIVQVKSKWWQCLFFAWLNDNHNGAVALTSLYCTDSITHSIKSLIRYILPKTELKVRNLIYILLSVGKWEIWV